jgi:sugar lactone lactonase YvrE
LLLGVGSRSNEVNGNDNKNVRGNEWSKRVIASHFHNKRFNAPNDMAVNPLDHSLFFTDPPYGLQPSAGASSLQLENHPSRQLDFCGVYRVGANAHGGIDSGSTEQQQQHQRVELVTKAFHRPNGIGFSPNGRRLYIGNSHDTNNYLAVTDLTGFGVMNDNNIHDNKNNDNEVEHENDADSTIKLASLPHTIFNVTSYRQAPRGDLPSTNADGITPATAYFVHGPGSS